MNASMRSRIADGFSPFSFASAQTDGPTYKLLSMVDEVNVTGVPLNSANKTFCKCHRWTTTSLDTTCSMECLLMFSVDSRFVRQLGTLTCPHRGIRDPVNGNLSDPVR